MKFCQRETAKTPKKIAIIPIRRVRKSKRFVVSPSSNNHLLFTKKKKANENATKTKLSIFELFLNNL